LAWLLGCVIGDPRLGAFKQCVPNPGITMVEELLMIMSAGSLDPVSFAAPVAATLALLG
jgi:hypothetical protein